jgi:peptidoglycan/LPS O-acetylase OafA/YrhL
VTAVAPASAVPRTVSVGLRGHDNALGLIRLLLASAVLVSHTFPLGGFGPDPVGRLTHGQADLGSLSVAGFFGISGYLIVKSGMSADIVQFLWRRVLRIFPAFFVVLILAAFVLGPVIWMLDGHAFASYFSFAGDSPWHYLASDWTLRMGAWGVRDVFQHTTPYGQATHASVLNGSLWTLDYEWTCYLVIAVLVVCGVLLNARPLVVVLALLFAAGQIVQQVSPGGMAAVFPLLFHSAEFLRMAYPFMVGAVIAVYARSVPLLPSLGVAAGVVMLVTLRVGGFGLVGVPAGVYFVLWLASALPARVRRIAQRNDYSYGVYVFAFPVQQTFAYIGWYKWGFLPMLLGPAVVVALLAWLSWWCVERPALRLKDWGPGRGVAYWLQRLPRLGRGGRRGREAAPEADSDEADSDDSDRELTGAVQR